MDHSKIIASIALEYVRILPGSDFSKFLSKRMYEEAEKAEQRLVESQAELEKLLEEQKNPKLRWIFRP